jgi:hypothetical protein
MFHDRNVPNWLLLLAFLGRSPAGTLDVRIIDETGSSCPARVYLTDVQGEPKFAP